MVFRFTDEEGVEEGNPITHKKIGTKKDLIGTVPQGVKLIFKVKP